MARAAAWAQKKAPRRFTAMIRSNWAGVVAMKGVRVKIAALLTSTSRRPRRATVLAMRPRASAGLPMSAAMATARQPREDSSLTVARASADDR